MTTSTVSPTQAIVNRLVVAIDRNSVETHINMCIATRRSFDNDTDAMLGVLTYLAHNLGHRLHADEAVTLATSVMALDKGITSINL
jgi:hypothetical protein